MIIREPSFNDLLVINILNNTQDFQLSSLNNKIVDRIVFDDDGNPIAYGIVKAMAEAIFLVEPTASDYKRALAMKKLMEVAEESSRHMSLEQIHTFVSNQDTADMLEKHFGFVPTKDIVLVKVL